MSSSQEVLAQVEVELKDTLKRKQEDSSHSSEEDEGDSQVQDLPNDSPAKKRKTSTPEPEETEDEDENEKEKIKEKEPPRKRKKPVMERTKSLDAIGKHPPGKILRVCLEKATNLAACESKDIRKIKYWLKIASTTAQQIDKDKEFSSFIQNFKKANGSDPDLSSMLEENFLNTSTETKS